MANDKFRVIKSVNKTSSGKGSTNMNQIDETCLIINTGSNAGVYLGVNGGFGECVANYSQDEKVKANTSNSKIYLVGQDDVINGTIESTYKNASVYMQSGKMYATSGNINSSETALVTGAAVNTAINTALASHKQEFTIGANKYAKITGGGIFTAFISVGSTLGNARHMSCWSSYGSGQSMRTNIKHIINGTDIYIDESDTGPIIYIKGYSQQTVIHILCSLSSFTCEELSSLPANVSITNTNSNNYTLAVKSDIPTKLSQLTDDVVTGKYLPITGGPIRNNSVTIPLTLASSKEAYTGMCFVNKNNESGYLIYRGGSDYGVTDDGWTATYTLLHTGNYTNYCKDTKVTSAANHYEPSNNDSSKLTLNASSNTSATWGRTDLITGLTIKRDNRGHVVDVSISSIQLPSNPNTDYQTTKAGHYTPSDKDSSVTATARGTVSWSGAVVTGVTKDSKGHITGVTTSTIPSNPNTDTKVTVNTSTGTVYLVGQSGITNGTNSTLYKNSSVYMSNGSITAYSFFETSDERLKTFTDDIDIDLNKLSDLRKSYFTFNSDESNKSHIGISAQEVQKLYPEIVNTNEDGYLSVDYAKLSVIALKAVDVLYNQNKDFERRLKEIEDKLK